MRPRSFLLIFPTFLGIFSIFWVFFRLLQPGSAAFRVVGPGRPLVATVGSDVVLPCRLSPKSDARAFEIRWIRDGFSETVHHYRAGEEQRGEQLNEYKGRTEMATDALAGGDLDLRIARVEPSDDGQFVCTVKDGQDYQEATVELEVAAVGSVPHLSLESYVNGGIQMRCRSAGWYPQPELLWRDPNGGHLPSVSKRLSSDQSGLFAIEDSIVVTKDRNGLGTWSCMVRTSRSRQEQESSLHISAPFFDDARPFMAAFGVFFVLSLVLAGLTAYCYRGKLTQARELGQKVEELVWRKFLLPQNPDVVTLDTDTAHANLVLSNDLRGVRWESTKLGLPETDRRFKSRCCVLGRQGFEEGRHCWKVMIEGQIEGDAWWALGVAKESVEKQDLAELSSGRGVWAVQHRSGQFVALTSPRVPLSVFPVPKSIWVFLDRTHGTVAFADAEGGAEFYRFGPVSFGGEKIHPWFRVETGKTRLCLDGDTPQPPHPPGPGGTEDPKIAPEASLEPLLGAKGDEVALCPLPVLNGGPSASVV